MSAIDWEVVVETIRDESCVLFLGPGLLLTKKNQPFWDEMVEELNLHKGKELTYFEGDDLFFCKDPILRTRTYFKIKAFYREEMSRIQEEIYEKLARIQFHLVVSISPDQLLTSIMNRLDIPHQFAFYNKAVNPGKLASPTRNHPLIYNLFGSIEDQQSLLLTHEDLYDFLFAILGDHKLPDDLQAALGKASNYLFIGFEFDKWYMQLLMRLLNLHDERYSFDRYASKGKLDGESILFYREQFRINFIEDELAHFVEELFKNCEAGGVIRDTNEDSSHSLDERLKNLLEEEKIDQVMELMEQFFQSKGEEELGDDVQLLSSRYKRLQRKIGREVINEEDANVESNKILAALLELIKNVRELLTPA